MSNLQSAPCGDGCQGCAYCQRRSDSPPETKLLESGPTGTDGSQKPNDPMTDRITQLEAIAKPRPAGKGVGRCPSPMAHGRCGCHVACKVCGHPLHSAIHMHVYGEKIGDPPYGHEFAPKDWRGHTALRAALAAMKEPK